MRLPTPITFEWDGANIDKNWMKHGIHHREIEEVFANRPILIFPDVSHSVHEKRYMVYGKSDRGILLTVIFTVRDKKIRVISARNQHKKERSIYEK